MTTLEAHTNKLVSTLEEGRTVTVGDYTIKKNFEGHFETQNKDGHEINDVFYHAKDAVENAFKIVSFGN